MVENKAKIVETDNSTNNKGQKQIPDAASVGAARFDDDVENIVSMENYEIIEEDEHVVAVDDKNNQLVENFQEQQAYFYQFQHYFGYTPELGLGSLVLIEK